MKTTQTVAESCVVGNGWTALGAVSRLAGLGKKVVWLTGTRSHLLLPLPVMENTALDELSEKTSYLREFRNKSFREPEWMKDSAVLESLWEAERVWIPSVETRAEGQPWVESEEKLRIELESNPNVIKIDGVPILKMKLNGEGAGGWILNLADGSEVCCQTIYVADRVGSLSGVDGFLKPVFERGRDPHGVLQVVFTHSQQSQESGLSEGIYAALPRDSGETIQRHVWGQFFDSGRRSVWSVVLTPEEGEDNHEVAKKLRKIKHTLDKIFPDFMKRVEREQVRYEEGMVFASGKPLDKPMSVPGMRNVFLMTDAYGPSRARMQVEALGLP